MEKSLNTSKVNRVEVIDQNGRAYVQWDKREAITVECQLQDEGRTLKVFISGDTRAPVFIRDRSSNDLIAKAKEMINPPQPCVYSTLSWRRMVTELVQALEKK